MKYVLKGGDQEFDRFKSEVNQNIPNLTKEWWDRIEVHLHGGIYQGQVEYGIVDDEEEEEDDDISKIVTLTAVIGYAYISDDWEEGARLEYYIDDIHNHDIVKNTNSNIKEKIQTGFIFKVITEFTDDVIIEREFYMF